MSSLTSVPRGVSLPTEEERVLSWWKQTDTFRTSVELNQDKPPFVFYDGPPFATGRPHYGHVLAGTIKDLVTRYAHMTGHHVERRFGWDCHGLPVEFEVDSTHGFDFHSRGLSEYNDACRALVKRHSAEWENVVSRCGRWIDFENDYKTMDGTFMETVWWVFGELWKKGLVYRGFKVMPYSNACTTPLSNFEVAQEYREVEDPAVTVAFRLVGDDENASLLVWTTTPWTLPANLALCVREDLVYVKFRLVFDEEEEEASRSRVFYASKNRMAELELPGETEVLSECLGSDLVGLSYVPVFGYYSDEYSSKNSGYFTVLGDDFVTEESGTGVVHLAPAFGADDLRVCLAHGLVQKDGGDSELPCPLDLSGHFVEPVSDFVGVYCKDADDLVVESLKKKGLLVKLASVTHQYPFCWRSKTPLIYRAVSSWFVRVTSLKERLLECNAETYWVPTHVKENRFANWLEDARDWCLSRTRYWGCPMPVWVSEDGEEVVVVKSLDELEALTGVRVRDLHREFVDHLVVPSKMGKGDLHRVPEVFDCWFESGSMPYAHQHYPFEDPESFSQKFPADFIAEGLDQTRGWFYTLLVLGVALFDKAPFKNVVVNGLVLAEDGKKMSKSERNFPDPLEVVNEYGADALRLYLVHFPVVRGEPMKFSTTGVAEMSKTVLLPLYNAYRMFVQSAQRYDVHVEGGLFSSVDAEEVRSPNVMDRYVLSQTQSFVQAVRQELDAFKLYAVIPRLMQFVDNLTNWYVRLNRRRLKGEAGDVEWKFALTTLYRVLSTTAVTLAPLTPFLSETMWMNLKKLVPEETRMDSVHFLPYPHLEKSLVLPSVDASVARIQQVVVAGRRLRDRRKLSMKFPLPLLVVLSLRDDFFDGLEDLRGYLREELNVKEVEFRTDVPSFYSYTVTPEKARLGRRLRSKLPLVTRALEGLVHGEVLELLRSGELTVLGEKLETEDVRVGSKFTGDSDRFCSTSLGDSDSGTVWVLMDHVPSHDLMLEGHARSLLSKVQSLRKKADLEMDDPARVSFVFHGNCDESEAVVAKADLLARAMRPQTTFSVLEDRLSEEDPPLAEETVELDSERSYEVLLFRD